MFVIKADIELIDRFRTSPIQGDTYRPLLFFSDQIIRSGHLVIEPCESLQMGKTYNNRIIEIYFHEDIDVEKEFYVGREFTLREGGQAVVGKAIITAIIGIRE